MASVVGGASVVTVTIKCDCLVVTLASAAGYVRQQDINGLHMYIQ